VYVECIYPSGEKKIAPATICICMYIFTGKGCSIYNDGGSYIHSWPECFRRLPKDLSILSEHTHIIEVHIIEVHIIEVGFPSAPAITISLDVPAPELTKIDKPSEVYISCNTRKVHPVKEPGYLHKATGLINRLVSRFQAKVWR
jgi:hypothetical protein